MIDEIWQEDYGVWNFLPRRFCPIANASCILEKMIVFSPKSC